MKELELYSKKLNNQKENVEVTCKMIYSVKDKINYTRTFIKGFNKKK